MLHTNNHISIQAPAELVYELAQDITRWPQILAHYRYVQILPELGDSPRARLVKMAAERSGIPVSWISVQEIMPSRKEIRYRHVGGVTQGMAVVWRIDSVADRTEVTIEHDLVSPRWWLRWQPVEYIVGRIFVHNIADKTLRGIKRFAEPAETKAKAG